MEDLPGLHLLRKSRQLLIHVSFQTNWQVRIKTTWYMDELLKHGKPVLKCLIKKNPNLLTDI